MKQDSHIIRRGKAKRKKKPPIASSILLLVGRGGLQPENAMAEGGFDFRRGS